MERAGDKGNKPWNLSPENKPPPPKKNTYLKNDPFHRREDGNFSNEQIGD